MPTANCYGLWRDRDHISLKQLWEYFSRYPYLPRLCDKETLMGAVQNGVNQITWTECFAYAAHFDGTTGRYQGLTAAESLGIMMNSESVLVKPEVAQQQMDEDRREREQEQKAIDENGESYTTDTGSGKDDLRTATGSKEGATKAVQQAQRFYGTIELDNMVLASEAGKVADAVVQHLTGLPNARITVTLEIEAELPDGVSEHVRRTVTENAHTLKFRQFGFEDDA